MESAHTYQRFSESKNRAFVSDNGLATITCPNCGLTKQVPVANYCGKRQTVKVRCRCKESFSTQLDFRQSHRKRADLSGIYQILNDRGGGIASIRDISKDGIGFTVSGTHNVKVGQKIQLVFSLDDRKQTPLQKQAVVRSVHKNRIGCEFSRMQAFEKDLGFYLRT
jgi:hypothetical protein